MPWPKAKVSKFESKPNAVEWKGTHFAYDRPPWHVIHCRQVIVDKNDRWQIYDELQGQGRHKLELRWHLPLESEIVCGKNGPVRVRLLAGWFLEVSAEHIIKIDWLKASPNGGWQSLYYNDKQPICTLSVVIETDVPAGFVTTVWKEMK
jgi:hypothetical protein